jgi:hypothetical protein
MFEEFCRINCTVESPILEFYVLESGEVLRGGEFEKIPVTATNASGLNMGRDTEETLYKYARLMGKVGEVATLNVPVPVKIDMTIHAAHQQYRYEHRYSPVTDEEILDTVKIAAPKIMELAINDGIQYGTMANAKTGEASNMQGMVWLFNIRTNLNAIVQARRQDRFGHAMKLTVLTILRHPKMMWKKAETMPKITVSETEARIVYVPPKTSIS